RHNATHQYADKPKRCSSTAATEAPNRPPAFCATAPVAANDQLGSSRWNVSRISSRYAASATASSHFASRSRLASFAGRGAPWFFSAAAIVRGRKGKTVYRKKTKTPAGAGAWNGNVGWFLADHALRGLAAGRGRLQERLRRGDRQARIVGKPRPLPLLDDRKLPGGELLLALLVGQDDAAVAHAHVDRGLEAGTCDRNAIVRAEGRAADADRSRRGAHLELAAAAAADETGHHPQAALQHRRRERILLRRLLGEREVVDPERRARLQRDLRAVGEIDLRVAVLFRAQRIAGADLRARLQHARRAVGLPGRKRTGEMRDRSGIRERGGGSGGERRRGDQRKHASRLSHSSSSLGAAPITRAAGFSHAAGSSRPALRCSRRAAGPS